MWVTTKAWSHILNAFFGLLSVCAGSSRQLIGFDTEVDESIIHRIWERAGEFFPALKEASLSKSREVRVGLRPYSKLAKMKSLNLRICIYYI